MAAVDEAVKIIEAASQVAAGKDGCKLA